MNITELKNLIKGHIENDKTSPLYKDVYEQLLEILENGEYENVKDFYNDMSQGLQNGNVPNMIYYVDTHAFFDRHSTEILNLFQEAQYEYEARIPADTEAKNWMAWFGFEVVMFDLFSILEIE